MGLFSWLWIGWTAAFLTIEGTALATKDTPSSPHTLSANIWWLIRGAGPWHKLLRALLAIGLATLTTHLLS